MMRTVRKEPLPNDHLIVMTADEHGIMINDSLTASFGHGETIADAIASHRATVADTIAKDAYWRNNYREAGELGQQMYDAAYAMFARAETAVHMVKLINALGSAILYPTSRLMVWLADKTRTR